VDTIDKAIAATDEGPEVVIVNPDGTVDGQDEPTPISKGRGKVATGAGFKKIWPQEVLDAAEGLIDPEYIRDGGDYREDNRGIVYWLALDHLVEFELADKRIDTDKDFWAWFSKYRYDNHIETKKKTSTKWRSFGDDEYKSSWGGSGGKNYMTSWWGGWGYGSGSDLTRRLTIAVGAVQSIVEVINDTGKRFRTELAAQDTPGAPTSYTSFDEQLVVVSPQALLDNSVNQDEGIEITAGWGLHEGSHVRFTSHIADSLTKPTVLRPLALAGTLFNIVEDVRIEAKTSEQYPGFAGYFEKANNYLWDVTKQHAPIVWGPELGDKINAITASVKWSTEYGQIVAAKGSQELKDEYTWFTAWADRYKAEKKEPRIAFVEALRHLEEDEKTKKQMDQQTSQEKSQESANGQNPSTMTDKEFGDLLKQLKEGLGVKIEACPSPGGSRPVPGVPDKKVRLTAEQSKEINKLLREQFQQDGATNIDGVQSDADIVTIMKPEETDHSRALYKKPGALVAKMKAAFVFRKIAPEFSERALRSGNIDEDMLWRTAGHDLQVFERKVITTIPDTQVTMLVDMSSSMNGKKVQIAQELANTMLECLTTMRGVRVRVRGHQQTGYSGQGSLCHVNRIWEKGDPRTRLGLLQALCAGGTPDGLALDWCAKEMLANKRPGEDMVLIILSDGEPNASPKGLTGPEHVHHVVKHFEKYGVSIIQIAIDPSLRAGVQARMYKHWIQFETEQKLPAQLTRLLIKLFGGASS
jgi:hypothetical protein